MTLHNDRAFNATRPASPRATIETLETRRLYAAHGAPAVTASVVEGTLEVSGTNKSDVIFVSMQPGGTGLVQVESGSALVGAFDPALFPNGVNVKAGNGNDQVVVFGDVLIATHLEGGNGKDVLAGGGANDLIEGGNGVDQMAGGAGDDTLDGGNGRDDLDGGAGNDTLAGGKGVDHVVGGLGADVFKTSDRTTEQADVVVGEDSVIA
jgi:Ca2+-binding RTX toxin-like protein